MKSPRISTCKKCGKILTRRNVHIHQCMKNDHIFAKRKKLETRESHIIRHYADADGGVV